MTNVRAAASVAFAALAAAMALAPGAQAHGAGEAREVDLRVLLDDDGGLGYGGCGPSEQAGAACTPAPEGLDVLALDVREAWLGDAPAIAFRMVVQGEAGHAGRGLLLTLTANGTQRTFAVASPDGVGYTSTDFDLLQGPFDVADGHPKAIDGWLRLSTLGAAAGDQVTGIHLDSTRDGEPDDVMPGTYYSNGVAMPHLPHGADPGEALEEHFPGTYAIKGPAPLLTLEATPLVLDLGRDGNATLRITNPLAATAQTVTLRVLGDGAGRFPTGAAEATLSLEPGATQDLTVRWPTDAAGGNATLLATSDLGARMEQVVRVVARPIETATASPGSGGKESPGLALLPLGLAALAMARAGGRR